MQLDKAISTELLIPKHYTQPVASLKNDRIIILVHQTWLETLLKEHRVPDFIFHESLSYEDIEAALLQNKNFSSLWVRVLVEVVLKPRQGQKALSIRPRPSQSTEEAGLSYPLLLHYISHTNYKNLWKHQYKKYLGNSNRVKKNPVKGVAPREASTVLRDIFSRFYGCPFISLIGSEHCSGSTEFQTHSNIMPACCVLEAQELYFILHPVASTVTLKDFITFSPTVFTSNLAKPLFIIYQYIQALKESHDRSLILGDVRLEDIYITQDLFIKIVPVATANLFYLADDDIVPLSIPRPPIDGSLATYCKRWVSGDLSNYEYLMHLNAVAGRRFGIPSCHFVFPWVSDLSTRSSISWRDLSRSKFRLNKGDRQLDLTFEHSSSSQVPHHVSDVLSEITYYVYLARRTPRSVLCKYVRSTWVPAEYPSSIQRLQEWTPDECIPEFFNDPSIFKSIHEDLSDLEVPPWASSPEEFIAVHREQLESRRVSEKLHNWIDLTFGYKLSGQPAVKAKNVCLHLASDQAKLSTSGVVQVFNHPHPKRQTHLPGFDKKPPKQRVIRSSYKEELLHSSDNEDDEYSDVKSSPLMLHRFLSLSRTSLLTPFQGSSDDSTDKGGGSKSSAPSGTSGSVINLSKDHNPLALLNAVESVFGFHMKTFGAKPLDQLCEQVAAGIKQTVAAKRLQEMQILGCLIMEIFLYSKLRLLATNTVEERIAACIPLLATEEIPYCVRSALQLLLNKFPPITDAGLPPPSAHQILQPLLSSFIIPFPKTMPPLYTAVARLKSLENFEDAQEFRVKLFSKDLDGFFDERSVDLVIPFIKDLLNNPTTTSLTVSLLLDKVLRCLGVSRTNELLLDTLIGLYERNPIDCFLYQRRFLLILIARCGLDVFLENFVVLIIEAIGQIGCSPDVAEGYEEADSSPEVEKPDIREETMPEVSVFAFDRDDTPSDGESLQNFIEQLNMTSEDEEDANESLEAEQPCLRIPSVPVQVPRGLVAHVTTIQCEVGSKNSDSSAGYPTKVYDEMSDDSMTDRPSASEDWDKVHEISADSVLWLSRRLGPVLTAKHVSRNLLKMLTLCYTGQSALTPVTYPDELRTRRSSISEFKVIGDNNASFVVKCLGQLVYLYGEQFILVQYLPFMSELISVSKRKLTYSVEGGLVGSLVLLKHVVTMLSDTTLMEHLQDVILKNIVHPLVRLMVSTRQQFPSRYLGRLSLATKLVDTLYTLAVHIGAEMTRVHLAVPSLQRFFLAFDKAVGATGSDVDWNNISSDNGEANMDPVDFMAGITTELKKVFSPQLAHSSYLSFFRLLGEQTMESIVVNHDVIRRLCMEYEQQAEPSSTRVRGAVSRTYLTDVFNGSECSLDTKAGSGSFGSNVAIIGNKIELHGADAGDGNASSESSLGSLPSKDSSRHLRGNWLAYWEHEIGRSVKDTRFNFKQIKLQSFTGHNNAVRCFVALDNENSLISGSRDKTVKLWSLRSQGDGSTVSPCQFTYTGHRKSLLAVSYLSGPRLIGSSDSTIHLWDPFVAKTVSVIDPGRAAPFSVLKDVPGPGYTLVAGTTETTLRIIDTRTASPVSEFKISWTPAGLIRSICVSEDASWVAVGQSSGYLTVLDLRTGLIHAAWKGHEGEVLQLKAVGRGTLLSSSLDQAVSVWNALDGKLKFHMKGPTEPVHCVQTHGSELITGTTANRIGVHTGIDSQAGFSSTKLRSDTFKGVLTSMAILKLNMQLILGADNGQITLLC